MPPFSEIFESKACHAMYLAAGQRNCSVFGRPVKIGETRGRIIELDDSVGALVTVHPSYLLRIREEEDKKTAWKAFLSDLRIASARLAA